MPRGGARVGSGRKPKSAHGTAAVVTPFTPAAVVNGGRSDEVSTKAPKDLPEAQVAFWETYAPAAIAARTLTEQTVGAFRLLCELDSEKSATKAAIDRDGRT